MTNRYYINIKIGIWKQIMSTRSTQIKQINNKKKELHHKNSKTETPKR
jgi:hypothetical protein